MFSVAYYGTNSDELVIYYTAFTKVRSTSPIQNEDVKT